MRRARAEVAGLRVVRIRGLEAEVEMAWSGLAGLLDGFLDRVDDLPPARAAAILRRRSRCRTVAAPVEPFAVAVATRDLLAEADEGPILVVVDDVPWIDQPSRLVLAYIADHVELEHIAVARRPPQRAGDRADLGVVIEVGGLPADSPSAARRRRGDERRGPAAPA